MKGICGKCNQQKETRPYGPGGSDICYECAFSTPESTTEVEANYELLLNAAAEITQSDYIGIGTQEGPIPL